MKDKDGKAIMTLTITMLSGNVEEEYWHACRRRCLRQFSFKSDFQALMPSLMLQYQKKFKLW